MVELFFSTILDGYKVAGSTEPLSNMVIWLPSSSGSMRMRIIPPAFVKHCLLRRK